jgi:hypothetical protein
MRQIAVDLLRRARLAVHGPSKPDLTDTRRQIGAAVHAAGITRGSILFVWIFAKKIDRQVKPRNDATIEMAATIECLGRQAGTKLVGGGGAASCKRRSHSLFSSLFFEISDPGVQNAAVTASINVDDGRANALVRRGSSLGLTRKSL